MRVLSLCIATFSACYLQTLVAQTLEPLPDQQIVGSTQSTEPVDSDQSQSAIKTRQAGSATVKEYHAQGKTYKIEVAPKDTPAYILSDQDGNGNLNSTDTNIDTDVVVPEWKIGSW